VAKPVFESLEDLAPKDLRELSDRKEEARSRFDPALPVQTQPSPSGDAVDVGVRLEELIPRVEHRDDARSSPEVASADLDQGRCGRVEEERWRAAVTGTEG
jgi:hypothetical protein